MPELPEVETTARGLEIIRNQEISKVKIHTKKLRFEIPITIKIILSNSKISNIRRIAKYIIADLNNGYSFIIHLGMSGRLKTCLFKYKREKHDHLIISFINKKILVYNDP